MGLVCLVLRERGYVKSRHITRNVLHLVPINVSLRGENTYLLHDGYSFPHNN